MEPKLQNKFFKASKLFEDVTVISGLGGELAYLIEGKERALLIDGLCGVGPLWAFVRELTELPVQVALTHGHIDHNGVAFEAGECFLHPDDIAMMYRVTKEARLGYATSRRVRVQEPQRTTPTLADAVESKPIKIYPIYDGDVFDLGGVQLEVISVPGHTYGTVVFLDRARRVVYSGDACNTNTLVGLRGSTTIEEYKESLLHFKAFQPAFDVMYGGHGASGVPNSIIDDGIALCDLILAGKDDAVPAGRPGMEAYMGKKRGDHFLPEDGTLCNIMYSKEMLYKRPHPVITDGPNSYR